MSREPWGPWAKAMERQRFVDPRNGYPSWRRLADHAGVGTTTLVQTATGQTRPRPETIEKIAAALQVTPGAIWKWLQDDDADRAPSYVVPTEIYELSPDVQQALTDLIRAVAADQRKGAGGDEQRDAAPMKRSRMWAVQDQAARRGSPQLRREDEVPESQDPGGWDEA